MSGSSNTENMSDEEVDMISGAGKRKLEIPRDSDRKRKRETSPECGSSSMQNSANVEEDMKSPEKLESHLAPLSIDEEKPSTSTGTKTVLPEDDFEELSQTTEVHRGEVHPASQDVRNFGLHFDSKSFTPDGLKKTLHGDMYQLGLLILAATRARREKKDFYLITEAAEFLKFDDLVIDYGESITLLQAKHSSKKDKCYSDRDFCENKDGDASLAKYFDSWYKLKDSNYCKTRELNPKPSRYVFFTNRGVLDKDKFLEDAKVDEDDFLFKDLKTETLKFKKGICREQFIVAIRASSDEIKMGSNKYYGNKTKPIQIDSGKLQEEIEEVRKYLEKKMKEGKSDNENDEIIIDGRSRLSKKALALIDLFNDDEAVAKEVLGESSSILQWIKINRLVVKMDNPRQVFSLEMEKVINDFLDELIIKVEQPNSNILSDIIAKELRLDTNIGAQELYLSLSKYIMEFFSNPNECLLKSESFGEFVKIQEGDLHRFYLLSGTKTYVDECKEKGVIDYEKLGKIEGLDEFLKGCNGGSVVIVSDNGGGAKQRIYYTLSDVIVKYKVDEWSFLLFSNENMKLLSKVLSGHCTSFVIIDCRGYLTDDLEPLQNVCRAVTKQKLILLINEAQKTSMETLNSLENTSNIITFDVGPLTDHQIQQICGPYNDKYISLAGKDFKIQDVITNKVGSISKLIRYVDYLRLVIECSSPDASTLESEMPYGVYVPNQMRRGDAYYDLSIIIRKIADYYVIENIEYSVLLSSLKKLFQGNEQRFSEVSKGENSKVEFILLQDINLINNYRSKTIILTHEPSSAALGDKKCILLKCTIANSTKKLQVSGKTDKINLPFPEGTDFTYQAEQKDFIKTITNKGHLSILMSPAGFGKTSFCINISETHRKSNKVFLPIWVIKLHLPKLQFDENKRPILTEFINLHHKWQEEAFYEDCEYEGRVSMILDGFDEVKSAETTKLINDWIRRIHKSTSLLITTREYAANKLILPPEKNVTHYKLTEYTEDQRQNYIGKYINAILNGPKESERFVTAITEEVTSKLNDHSSKVLGIPLESYICCELLKPHLLMYVKQNGYKQRENNTPILAELNIDNTVELYQEFILSKSMLFLKKHLGVKRENIVKKEMIFNLMGSYNQVIELYALKQAFNLPDITKFISSINFDITALKTLQDTGLLTVSEDCSTLNFNHETYQEFYAALAIIRGLLSGPGDMRKLVEDLVKANRYDPKFTFVFSLASQFSVSAGSMIPGYSRKKHLLSFWEILGDDGDVIGAGANRLFKSCLSNFSIYEKDILLHEIRLKQWVKFVRIAIDNKKQLQNTSVNDDNNEEGLRSSIQQMYEDYDSDVVKKLDTSKDRVAHDFSQLKKKGALKVEHIKALEKEAEQHKEKHDPWAVDGGIDAISYTGKFFSRELAEYLVLRASCWINNQQLAISALGAIYGNLDSNIIDTPHINCFFVIKNLMERPIHKSNVDAFKRLLHIVNSEFIDYLKNYLHEKLRVKEILFEYLLNLDDGIFDKPVKTIKSILTVAEMLQYAVIMEGASITMAKEKK